MLYILLSSIALDQPSPINRSQEGGNLPHRIVSPGQPFVIFMPSLQVAYLASSGPWCQL